MPLACDQVAGTFALCNAYPVDHSKRVYSGALQDVFDQPACLTQR